MIRARDNPFRTEQLEKLRYRPAGTTWEALWSRLGALNYRAAILGSEGSGKTTLLAALGERLTAAGWELRRARLWADGTLASPERWETVLGALTGRQVVLMDGADHLGWIGWRWLRWRCRRAGGLIVTSHTRRLLPVLIRCETSPALLAELLRDLLGPDAPLHGAAWERCLGEHGGNLREVWRAAYLRYAEGAGPPT